MLELWIAAPDPLIWKRRKRARKLADAGNIVNPTRIQIFHCEAALALRVTVPDPLRGKTGSPRRLGEAKNIIIPRRIRIFPGGGVLEPRDAVPDSYMGAPEGRGRSWKLTESKNAIIPPRFRILPGTTSSELWVPAPDPLTWTHRKPRGAHGR